MFQVVVEKDPSNWVKFSPTFDSLDNAVAHYHTVLDQIGDAEYHDPQRYSAQFDFGQHGPTVSLVHHQLKAELDALDPEGAGKTQHWYACHCKPLISKFTVKRNSQPAKPGNPGSPGNPAQPGSPAKPAQPAIPAKSAKVRKSRQVSHTKLYAPKPAVQAKTTNPSS